MSNAQTEIFTLESLFIQEHGFVNTTGYFLGVQNIHDQEDLFLYLEKLDSKREALQRELEIKKMSHSEKFHLIDNSSNGILKSGNY